MVHSSDPNCGKAYQAAVDDTLAGYAYGCSQANPVVPAVAPSVQPVCS